MNRPKSTGGDSTGTSAAEVETLIEPLRERDATEEEESLTPGTRLGRYVVLEEIGSGGMGLVFSAYDPELNRKVALKLLRPRHRERKRTRNRLLKEAQALAKLAHPNVITVYDVGTLGELVFVAMELVEGDTLSGWMARKRRKWNEVLEVFIPAGRGLAAAHAANLVHRDFKPDNVLIGRDGRVRVMDFGLARPMQADEASGSSPEVSEDEDGDAVPEAKAVPSDDSPKDVAEPMLTQTGSIMGTPAYMAPEQHLGKPTDARSDQFSFCIALWQGLYGERPFDGSDPATLTRQKLEGAIAEPSGRASVPAWVRRCVLRGLSPAPEDRFASMDELLDALSKDPRARRRKIAAGVGATAVVVSGVLGIHYVRTHPQVCRNSPEALAAVWNDTRRAAAELGLRAVDRAHVEASWKATVSVVDAYADAWVQMHREACEATHIRGEQSSRLLELRNNCLRERLDEIDALAEELARADAGVAARAVAAAYGLSPLSACADSEALAAAVDPPQGEALAAAVAEIRARLARVKVLAALGKYDEALASADAAYADARALADEHGSDARPGDSSLETRTVLAEVTEDGAHLERGYPPVVAEARFRLGQVQGLRGDGEEAEKNLSESSWLASSVKHDAIAAAALRELVFVVGRQMRNHQEGFSWARHAEAAIKRIGLGGHLEARLRLDMAVLFDRTGELDKAEASIQQALDLFADAPASDLGRIEARRALGDILVHRGRLDQAQTLFEDVLRETTELWGPRHPEVAVAMAGLARVSEARGRTENARETLEGAISLVEDATGPEDLSLVPLLEEFAAIHLAHEEYGPAIEHKKRIEGLLVARLGKHPRVANVLHEIGQIYERWNDEGRAREHHQRALEVWEATRGHDHPDVAYALTSLGRLDVAAGNPQQGVARLERALELRGGRGLDPRLLAQTQFALAQALQATGRDQPRARELATKARDTFAKGKSPDLERAAQIEAWLESTLRQDGRPSKPDAAG